MDIAKLVWDAKLKKGKKDIKKNRLIRRSLKLSEETGEVAEAVLGVTGKDEDNYKNKTYDDVREELIDAVIVSLDILLSTFPDEPDTLTYEEILKKREAIVNTKISKWLSPKEKKS